MHHTKKIVFRVQTEKNKKKRKRKIQSDSDFFFGSAYGLAVRIGVSYEKQEIMRARQVSH